MSDKLSANVDPSDIPPEVLEEVLRARSIRDARATEIKALQDQLAALQAETTADNPGVLPSPPTNVVINVEPRVPRPTVSTFSDLIGDFLPEERSDIELEHSSMQVISKSDRLHLNASDKSKLYTSFIKGSPNKFKASSTIVGLDEISTIENITSFGQLRLELQKHITSVSVHSVFLILKFNEVGQLIDPDTPAGAPTNLLSATVLPPLHEIEKSTFFHHKRGSAFNQENLVWSFEAVRNSCDKDLQGIIDAKMLKYKPSERFGPLYYFELVQQMTDVDSKAVRAITLELTSLKVTDQDGQSIAKVASIIRSTMIWLEMVNMLPPDIDAIVLDILETCTVSDFQMYLKTLAANASLNGIKLTSSTLLDRSEHHYRTLILSKKWDAAGHQGSSFQGQAQRTVGDGNRTRPPTIMPPWSRTAPDEGESHERTFESRTFKWCSICQRWFFGNRAHLTSEHIAGHSVRRPHGPPTPAIPAAPTAATNLAVPMASPPTVTPALTPAVSRNYFTGGL